MHTQIENEVLVGKTVLEIGCGPGRTTRNLADLLSKQPDANLSPQDIISVNPKFPIIWKVTDNNELLIAANELAHTVVTTDNVVITKLLNKLNSGEHFIATEIAEKYTRGNIPINVISNILQTLHTFMAFAKV